MKRKKEKNEKIFEIGYKSNNAICGLGDLGLEKKEYYPPDVADDMNLLDVPFYNENDYKPFF